MSHARGTTLIFAIMYLFPLTSEAYLLVNHFENPDHNTFRRFSCCETEMMCSDTGNLDLVFKVTTKPCLHW